MKNTNKPKLTWEEIIRIAKTNNLIKVGVLCLVIFGIYYPKYGFTTIEMISWYVTMVVLSVLLALLLSITLILTDKNNKT